MGSTLVLLVHPLALITSIIMKVVIGAAFVSAVAAASTRPYDDAFTLNLSCEDKALAAQEGNRTRLKTRAVPREDLDALETLPADTWSWHNVEHTQCMDGDSTGFYLRRPLNPEAVTGDKV